MYDVLHDSQYRRNWDPTMEESYDIARLSANADVGYYSCKKCVCVCECENLLSACHVCDVESDPPQTLCGTSERENANTVNLFLQNFPKSSFRLRYCQYYYLF